MRPRILAPGPGLGTNGSGRAWCESAGVPLGRGLAATVPAPSPLRGELAPCPRVPDPGSRPETPRDAGSAGRRAAGPASREGPGGGCDEPPAPGHGEPDRVCTPRGGEPPNPTGSRKCVRETTANAWPGVAGTKTRSRSFGLRSRGDLPAHGARDGLFDPRRSPLGPGPAELLGDARLPSQDTCELPKQRPPEGSTPQS